MELAKQKFLEDYPEYGYNNRLNDILSTEFPNLVIHPQIYLDNTAIPPIPTQLLISLATAQASLPWLQNPHSSPQIHDQINLTRLKLLNYFNCSELEYEVIFCSNVTNGLKLIGEHFPWTESSKLILSLQNHTSMVGIREYAQKAGSSTELINLEDLYNNEYKFNSNCDKSYNLLCLPAQTNWNGLKLPSALRLSSIIPNNTLTLIDFASYAQSNALNISEFGADFNLISFYKIFGIMTGLSCLIVKKSSLKKLNSGYFGGGSLLACDIYSPYKELNSNTCWEFGTPNYMDILNLTNCFNYFNSVFGNMESVRLHTKSLANWTKLELKKLKHYNNTPLIELYSNDEKFDYGPIIPFNVLRSNGDKVGLKHLESILNLNNIIVRVGSLCNPGSNQLYLNVTGEQVRDSFDKGIRCGDGELGVCRVSLGKVTTFEECFELVKVIREKFIEVEQPPPKQIDSAKNIKIPEVLEINIYPIKSCKSYKIPLTKPWPILKSGLKFDRKFKLINLDTRRTMIQKNYSILAQFVPMINFDNCEVCIDFNGDTSPIIKFGQIGELEVNRVIIDDKEESILILNTPELDLWLSKIFDFKVALITSPEVTTTYPNQAPLLAILSEDLEDFRLKSGVNYIPSNRFRANLTLQGVKLKAEDIIKIGNCQFKVEEPCERCSMITVDQTNSKRDLKIYSNLVKFGSNQGFGKFGWYLKLITEFNNGEEEYLFNCYQ